MTTVEHTPVPEEAPVQVEVVDDDAPPPIRLPVVPVAIIGDLHIDSSEEWGGHTSEVTGAKAICLVPRHGHRRTVVVANLGADWIAMAPSEQQLGDRARAPRLPASGQVALETKGAVWVQSQDGDTNIVTVFLLFDEQQRANFFDYRTV